jgi:hypothetical protein
LKQIAVENGDGTTPVLVVRELLDSEQVKTYPALCVIEAQRSTGPVLIEGQDGGGSMGYEHHFGVSVYGYVRASEGRSRSQWLEDLWADVTTKVMNSYTLTVNGVDLSMNIEAVGDRETDGGVLGEVGAFVQDFAVIYTTGQPAI